MDREQFQRIHRRKVYKEHNTRYHVAICRAKEAAERNQQRIRTYEAEIPKIIAYGEKLKASGEDKSAEEAARHLLKLEQEAMEKSRHDYHQNTREVEALTALSGLRFRA